MALLSAPTNVSYMEDDTGVNTRINIFKYQRPRPNAPLLKVPMTYLTLPLPVQMPDDHYNMKIGEVDLGEIGNLTGGQSGESVSQLTNTLKERLGTQSTMGTLGAALGLGAVAAAPAIADLAGGIAAIAGKGLGGAVAAALAQGALNQGKANALATLGLARNPHTALLFNGVELRTFTFHWKLSPRSQAQSQKLNAIISMIKRAMHPNLTLGGFALDYPNLFTVEFNNDKEGIVRLGYSFCSDLTINPTPSGHVYYRNGYPSIVDISMTLKEFQIKTAEDFDVDYGAGRLGGVTGSDAFVK